MRIEIIGLPGTGKTSLVKTLCSNKMIFHKKEWMSMDDVLFDWYKLYGNRKGLKLINFLIHFNRPSIRVRQLKLKMIRTIRTYAYNDLNEINDMFNPCCSIFIKAMLNGKNPPLQRIHGLKSLERPIIISRIAEQFFRNKVVLFDEGLGLRVITLARCTVPMDYIRRYCEALPAADAYVIMTLNNEFQRHERLIERGEGYERAASLIKNGPAMRSGLNCLIDIMNGKIVPILEIDAEHSIEENAERVEKFVQELISPEVKEKPS